MKKAEKTDLVSDLSQRFGRASMALVSEYKGMTAAESTELRNRLRAVRGEMRVAKNTLVRRAIRDTKFEVLDGQLGGPVGLILSFEDPIAVAKAVTAYKEAGDRFKLRGGVLEGKPLTREEIVELANMPPKEVVMAQLLGLLQAPASALVRLLNEPGSALARIADAIGKKNGGSAEKSAAVEPAAPAEPSAATEPPAAGESPGTADS
ncbi:MAG TPA: 50S ribosomal protein L10 [Candidatus Binataceae bacterium]|nr:50S ribosomal protein L10 [Candidatus Binataceae bacterium]